jgi:5' nucleotidase family
MQNSLNLARNSFLSFAFVLKQPKINKLFCVRRINTLSVYSQKVPKLILRSQFFSSKMANDEFCFDSYDIIGFDLDNCLVRYNVKNMIYLEYNCLAKFLVKRGYSKEFLLKPIEEDLDFLQKGLILDFEKGNLLRV